VGAIRGRDSWARYAMRAPHEAQKREFSGMCAPQLGHDFDGPPALELKETAPG
jgi:hypothetical protein